MERRGQILGTLQLKVPEHVMGVKERKESEQTDFNLRKLGNSRAVY